MNTDYTVDNVTGVTLAECKTECQNRILNNEICVSISHTIDDGNGQSVCLINSKTSTEVELLTGGNGVVFTRTKRSAVVWNYLDVSVTLGTLEGMSCLFSGISEYFTLICTSVVI